FLAQRNFAPHATHLFGCVKEQPHYLQQRVGHLLIAGRNGHLVGYVQRIGIFMGVHLRGEELYLRLVVFFHQFTFLALLRPCAVNGGQQASFHHGMLEKQEHGKKENHPRKIIYLVVHLEPPSRQHHIDQPVVQKRVQQKSDRQHQCAANGPHISPRENQHDGIYDTHNEQIRQAYQPPWIRYVKLCILCQCNEKVPYPVKRLVKLQFEAVEKGHKAIILVSFCSSQSRIGSPNLGKISRHMQISRAGTTLNQGHFLVLMQ